MYIFQSVRKATCSQDPMDQVKGETDSMIISKQHKRLLDDTAAYADCHFTNLDDLDEGLEGVDSEIDDPTLSFTPIAFNSHCNQL